MGQFSTFTDNNHFQLHFQEHHYIHYQADKKNNLWAKASWADLCEMHGAERIQYNTKKYKNYIILDIDHEDIYYYLNTNLPTPNFILKNKNRKGAHLFYVLDRTISHEYFTDLWRQVQKSFSIQANADTQNKGFIGKNIRNTLDFEYIELETQAYNILDLFQYVDKSHKHIKTSQNLVVNKQKQLINTESRNVDIFNTLRLIAYQEIKKSTNERDFKLIVSSQASKINSEYIYPLELNELNNIAESVIKYCIKNKIKIKKYKQKKKMDIDVNLQLKEKQKLAAKYTADVKNNKTELKIKVALIEMKKQQLKINISTVSNFTKMSRITIRKYKNLLK